MSAPLSNLLFSTGVKGTEIVPNRLDRRHRQRCYGLAGCQVQEASFAGPGAVITVREDKLRERVVCHDKQVRHFRQDRQPLFVLQERQTHQEVGHQKAANLFRHEGVVLVGQRPLQDSGEQGAGLQLAEFQNRRYHTERRFTVI